MSRGLTLMRLAVLIPAVGAAGPVDDAKRRVSLEVSDGPR